MIDPAKNGARGILASGIAGGATSLTLTSGDEANFIDPATGGAYNAYIWNATDYSNPILDPYYEIVRVTAKTGAALTMTRAQEGTSDSDHNILGKTYAIAAGITAKIINDIRRKLAFKEDSGTISGTTIPLSVAADIIMSFHVNGKFIHPADYTFAVGDDEITISSGDAAGYAGNAYTVIYQAL